MDDKIVNAMTHAGRFSAYPVYSLFGVSSRGDYELIETGNSAQRIADRFRAECIERKHNGLEIRADGVRVSW